jgi:hypothetical protein
VFVAEQAGGADPCDSVCASVESEARLARQKATKRACAHRLSGGFRRSRRRRRPLWACLQQASCLDCCSNAEHTAVSLA